MPFNSLDFALFLPVVFLLYWFVFRKNVQVQNIFIILASCFFYAWWEWKALILITITIVSTYFSGLGIRYYQSKNQGIRESGNQNGFGILPGLLVPAI